MTKSELIHEVWLASDLPRDKVKDIVDALTGIIARELINGGNVQIPGFGTFHIRGRAERKGRNPRTGEEIHLPASRYVHFAQGKPFKRALNQALNH